MHYTNYSHRTCNTSATVHHQDRSTERIYGLHQSIQQRGIEEIPPKRAWDHAIEFKKDTPDTIDCKVYPQTQEEDKVLQKFLTEEVEKGYIQPSKSPYASPFFYIKKKDGKLRLVQDYWKINAIMIRNQYPLPLISNLIHDLSNAHIYTKLDIWWGYNNVYIREGDEGKVASKCGMDSLNPWLCILVSPTHQQLSKL